MKLVELVRVSIQQPLDDWRAFTFKPLGVTSREAWRLGIYSVFIYPDVVLTRAIETPRSQGIRFHVMIAVALGDHGEISQVIDDAGDATAKRPRVTPKVTNFP